MAHRPLKIVIRIYSKDSCDNTSKKCRRKREKYENKAALGRIQGNQFMSLDLDLRTLFDVAGSKV